MRVRSPGTVSRKRFFDHEEPGIPVLLQVDLAHDGDSSLSNDDMPTGSTGRIQEQIIGKNGKRTFISAAHECGQGLRRSGASPPGQYPGEVAGGLITRRL
jgi:hypothetical protein